MLCNDSDSTEIVFTTDNQNGTTLYTWTNNDTSIGLGSGGTGNIASFNATNETTEPVTATITVTPAYDSTLDCEGPSKTFTITVNPTGQVDPLASQVVCNADTTTVEFSTENTVGTTTYEWISSVDLGSGLAGTGDISFTAINTTTDLLVSTFTVTPTFTNGDEPCACLLYTSPSPRDS